MPHAHAAALLAASLTVVVASAAAQESATVPPGPATPATPEVAAPADADPSATDAVKFTVAGGYLHQFTTDFDNSIGDVSIDRGYGVVGSSYRVSPNVNIGVRIAWEGGWYSFDRSSALSLGTGARPWHAVQGLQVGGRVGWKIDDAWSLSTNIFGGLAGESEADAGDALTFGGSVGFGWRASESFTIGGGVLASSRLEDDTLVIPLLLIDWKITESLRLSNVAGPEAYPTGAGIELVWSGLDQWEFGVGGRWESRRFRLDDSGPAPEGIGEDQGVGLWLRAGFRPTRDLSIDLLVGMMVGEELELSDRAGRELATVEMDPSPFVGCFLSYRF
ncbi:MAG: hypothetical protein SGJ11_13440 [Phycisphaerae bacterium]|nr:hypothetical protein [Phycisphaerae bacterium]